VPRGCLKMPAAKSRAILFPFRVYRHRFSKKTFDERV
jgi:hypothetical protein